MVGFVIYRYDLWSRKLIRSLAYCYMAVRAVLNWSEELLETGCGVL